MLLKILSDDMDELINVKIMHDVNENRDKVNKILGRLGLSGIVDGLLERIDKGNIDELGIKTNNMLGGDFLSWVEVYEVTKDKNEMEVVSNYRNGLINLMRM